MIHTNSHIYTRAFKETARVKKQRQTETQMDASDVACARAEHSLLPETLSCDFKADSHMYGDSHQHDQNTADWLNGTSDPETATCVPFL